MLIGATRSFEAALELGGTSVSAGWPWVGMLGVFALAYSAMGIVAFGPLLVRRRKTDGTVTEN